MANTNNRNENNESTHEKLSRAGEKGGHASSGRKAMETRAEREGKSVSEIAEDMGREGGKQSHGGGRK